MDTPGDVARSLQGYDIVETLGQGGFGIVYRTCQVAVGRDVALKVDNRVLVTERDKRRFMREVTAAGQLSGHPHVVAVYDAGVLDDGRPYMVLELCPNGSLADRLQSQGPLPAPEVRDIGVHIADALAAAHNAGVLHRDVKPANILVNRYGTVALADFGLAVLSTPGMESSATREALTPAYASPEAFNMAEPTPAGDVYALGATLYALLSGRPPYYPPGGPPNLVALMAARFGPVPDIPGAPPGLLAVLRHAMAYDPAHRPQGAAAFRDELAAADLSGGAPTPMIPVGGGYDPPTPPGQLGPQNPYPAVGGPGPMPPGGAGHGPVTPGGLVPQDVAGRHGAAGRPGAVEGAGFDRFGVEPTGPGLPDGSRSRARGSHRADASGDRRYETTGPAARGLSGPLLAAAIVLAVAVIGAGALVAYSIGSGRGSGGTSDAGAAAKPEAAGAKDAYGGAETVTQGCPAAAVPNARARCTKTAECWGGIVAINGNVAINRSDCAAGHVYETFAIAPLPSDGQTWNEHTLETHPTVKQVCSRTVMAQSRYGDALRYSPDKWSIEVVPPSQSAFDAGTKTFRCVATITGQEAIAGSMFRPRS